MRLASRNLRNYHHFFIVVGVQNLLMLLCRLNMLLVCFQRLIRCWIPSPLLLFRCGGSLFWCCYTTACSCCCSQLHLLMGWEPSPAMQMQVFGAPSPDFNPTQLTSPGIQDLCGHARYACCNLSWWCSSSCAEGTVLFWSELWFCAL